MVQAAIPAWAEEEQPQQDTVSAHTGNPLKRWRESEGSVSPAITLWEILSTESAGPGAAGVTSSGRRRPSASQSRIGYRSS